MVRVRKIALMGYPAVGKSSLAHQFVDEKFVEEYLTTIENQLTKSVSIGGRDFELRIFDTMGVTEQPNFPDDYLTMDGWVIVFSVAERRSLDIVTEIYDRIRVAGTQTPPVIIVGNKTDLSGSRQVSEAEGRKIAEGINAKYLETSAKTNAGVREVFANVIYEIERANGDPIKQDKGDCTIL